MPVFCITIHFLEKKTVKSINSNVGVKLIIYIMKLYSIIVDTRVSSQCHIISLHSIHTLRYSHTTHSKFLWPVHTLTSRNLHLLRGIRTVMILAQLLLA
jgi:hypothetical protein